MDAMTVLLILAGIGLMLAGSSTWRRMVVCWLYALRHGGRYVLDRLTGNSDTAPRHLRLLFEDLGPTFVKLGQIIASSSGMFPDRYVEEFGKCLDQVKPVPFEDVEAVLQRELGSERLAGMTIDASPLASASIAQVHRATLDDGTPVVVKVQRPNIEARVEIDVRVMRFAAKVLSKLSATARMANPEAIVDDFHRALKEELDFRQEADNLENFNDIVRELGHVDVRAPVPHFELTTRHVLVMEQFSGTRVDDLAAIEALGIDAEGALVKGIRVWFQCVILYGFFHGDVHAGNLMLLEGGHIGFLDFGIVGRFDETRRRQIADYIVAFATADFDGLVRVVDAMGGLPEDFDAEVFSADLERVCRPLLGKSLAELDYTVLLPSIHQVARSHSLRLPREFVLITKQLLYFDRYAKLLAPDLNVFADPRLLAGLMADLQRARSTERAET